MSVAEVQQAPLFGQITAREMADNATMARHVLSVVRDACKHSKGRFTVESVADGLADGSMSLYGVLRPPSTELEATVVVRPRDGVFEILVAGPDFEDVAPFIGVLEKYAKQAQCERMAIWGPQFFRHHLSAGWFAREVRYERKFDAD